jgi:hypothetical protein
VKKSLAVAVILLAASANLFAAARGAWTASTIEEDPGKIHFSITLGKFRQFGQSFVISRFPGLTADATAAKTMTPVEFQLRSEAGTAVFEGVFKEGLGAGQFRFTADPTYAEAVRKLGLTIDIDGDRSLDEEFFTLAMWDVSVPFIKSMLALFPGSTYRDIRRARGVDVTPQYIAAIRAAGLEIDDLHEAARVAGSGVTPEYVRSMRAAGVQIEDARAAARLAGSGVTAQFVAELAAAGYKNLTARELTRLAGSGVTAEFIREMSKHHK